MTTDDRLDKTISAWLEERAPARIPDRVLDATFERTRRTRQQAGWRALLGWLRITPFAPVLGGAIVVLAAVALVLGVTTGPIGPGEPVATDPPNPILGAWISTSDADGGRQTMTVRGSADAVSVEVHDTIASVCSGVPSTMTGSGRIEGDLLVVPAPDYTCDDGSEPQALSGPPLDEQLHDLTLVYNGEIDVLTDDFGGLWLREETPGASERPSPSAEPTKSPSPAEPTPVQPTSATDAPLGWSSDGTRLLIQRGSEDLFVLRADGSETQITEQLSGFSEIPGSARPSGATISPDGSRVVFAGLTRPWEEGRSCHDGALFVVGVEGGPTEVLWESEAAGEGGVVREPTFSPDGSRLAFADGYCDHDHSVWVMDADGSHAQRIVSSELEAGWVRGLAWSPAGDRLALAFEGSVPDDPSIRLRYVTFAPDGSGLTQGLDGSEFCWPGRQTYERCGS